MIMFVKYGHSLEYIPYNCMVLMGVSHYLNKAVHRVIDARYSQTISLWFAFYVCYILVTGPTDHLPHTKYHPI